MEVPSLQEALQTRRAAFVATSQKRVIDLKEKDYSISLNPSTLMYQTRSKSTKPLGKSSSVPSVITIETDAEERQKRVRESKERSKRLYEQLPEVQQKKKLNETRQQAQAYRARMSAFQKSLDCNKKAPGNKK